MCQSSFKKNVYHGDMAKSTVFKVELLTTYKGAQ